MVDTAESFLIQPSDEEKKSIYKYVSLDEDKMAEKLTTIKNWIHSQPHLPQHIEDADIMPFLVWSKGDLCEAQDRLDRFYSMRSYDPQLFGLRDPHGQDFKNSFDCSYVLILPKLYDGKSVLFASPKTEDAKLFTVEGLVRRVTLIIEMSLRLRPLNSGLSVILDENLANISHMAKINPTVVKKCIYSIQNAIPVRLKEVVIINVNSVVRVILQTMILPVLKKKIRTRIHIYSEGAEVLLNHFPKEILPKDYGGDENSLQELEEFINSYLISKREAILKENALQTNELLRDGEGPLSESKYCSVM